MPLDIREKTILAIDDEPGILEGIKEFLEGEYYNVLTATSGPAGLQLLKTHKPHLILLDIMMPGMSGFQTLTELKKNPETASIPVVMLTARMETGMIGEAKHLGAIDYIVKPFTPSDLIRWIKVYERYDPKKST